MYQKLGSDDVQYPRYGAQRTDGRTVKVTYRGKNKTIAKNKTIDLLKKHIYSKNKE